MSDPGGNNPQPTPISPAGGPVAVTGSAGFIGSHIVLNLVRQGYAVRACVRDAGKLSNTAHLSAMNRIGPGSVTLHARDMTVPGAYDDVFAGCSGVFHAAAEMGNLEGSTPMKVYEGGLKATKLVMDSIKKSGTVKRLVYTSSFAAVGHPAEEGHVHTEDCTSDMNQEMRREGAEWNMEVVEKNREVAYAMTKLEAERYVYAEAEKHGFTANGVCPCHVIGPLLSASHLRPWCWQTRIGDMLEGYGHPRMFWNIVDVRDVAETQRLIAESPDNKNGERYNLVATDESGLIRQTELQDILRRLYPGIGIGGIYREGKWRRTPLAVLQKPITQLGLKPHSVEETIRDNADSLLAWGLVKTRPGEDNWQREGNDLGIKSKWNPHTYPALDPEVKKKLEAKK
ncbi:NAD-dependent epimerase/dehydratase family protein [Candidatus Sumerlaeota bacterium]|nr:NAD-dependent epimerase/dehydratase family protein [Candidatus Sumerlaeota bacterium]